MAGSKSQEDNWDSRAQHYDKLFWTKDDDYLSSIFKVCQFTKDDIVLDVGVGTGAVAKQMSKMVKHVIGIDISTMMLSQGKWQGVSTIKWDIRNALFAKGIFDVVIGRMVFHHVVEGLDVAVARCYDALKYGGRIVVAEGVPPSDDSSVIDWYTNMFELKEDRLTFSENKLVDLLERNNFWNVNTKVFIMHNFNINNWLAHSGLPLLKRDHIMKLHLNAPQSVKKAYNMEIKDGECFVTTKNIIITGCKEK